MWESIFPNYSVYFKQDPEAASTGILNIFPNYSVYFKLVLVDLFSVVTITISKLFSLF